MSLDTNVLFDFPGAKPRSEVPLAIDMPLLAELFRIPTKVPAVD